MSRRLNRSPRRPLASAIGTLASGELALLLVLPLSLSATLAFANASQREGVTTSPGENGENGENNDASREEIVVRGLRWGRIEAPPSAFSTRLSSRDYEGEAKRLEEVLAEQVGVQLRRFGGPGERSELSIRGSTASQVAVLLDGVPLNSALSGDVDFSRLCLGLIDSVEITRGGGATRIGSGGVGGVVDLKTLRPGAESSTRVRASGGAFGTFEASLRRSGKATAGPVGSFDYSAGYCGFRTDGDYRFARPISKGQTTTGFDPPVISRVNNERVIHSASLALGRDFSERSRLQFRDSLGYASHGEPGLDSGNGPSGGQNLHDHTRSLRNTAQIEWTSQEHGWLGSEIDLSLHHRYERDTFNGSDAGDPAQRDSRTEISSFGARASDLWRFDRHGATQQLHLAFDAREDLLHASGFENHRRATLGALLRDDIRVLDDRIALVPALRLDWSQGFEARWLPGLGVVVSPWPFLRLKANVQKSYRAPNFDELYFPDKGSIRGNPSLRPETARNFDVGLELAGARLGPLRDLQILAGFFEQEIEESIVWMTISPWTVAPQNTGPARVRGYELGLRLALGEMLRINANHTGLEARSAHTGLALVGRARSETNVRVEFFWKQTWKLVGEYQHTGAIPVSSSGSRLLPARGVWNASASLDLAALSGLHVDHLVEQLLLFARLDNIGDAAIRDGLYSPQPGRSGTIGVEVQW